ncbi:MAG: hypothetical protein EXQ70_00955 [Solirubrobacterales bacterium]|nr:hypothetical protein [Solirubrobacterales bacterium]
MNAPLTASFYSNWVVETGREPQFLFFVSFLISWSFIRTSAHMIRAQVSWWPGNVSVGGTHIHHMFWGILLLLIFGWVGITVAPDSPWREIAAVMFGIGTGLTLDEFALWLNLKDVYWEKQGRSSIDAVVVAIAVTGLVLVGFSGWVEAADKVESRVFAGVGFLGFVSVVVAVINAAKEKFGMALIGAFFYPVGFVGAFRLGKPQGAWAKLFYHHRQLDRSKERYSGSRGKPFWKRGGELLGGLRLRRSAGSGGG